MALLKLDFFSTLPASPIVYIILTVCILPIIYLNLANRKSTSAEPRGCRNLGLHLRTSNLKDEYDVKYAKGGPPGQGDDDGASPQWRVKSLWIYPLKSCRGVELFRGNVVSTGLEYDRLFSFAQLRPASATGHVTAGEEDGSVARWAFLTQRNLPLMALIKTEVWVPDPTSPSYTPTSREVQYGGVLVVRFPNPDCRSGTLFNRLKSFAGLHRREITFNKIKDILGLQRKEITFCIPLNPSRDIVQANKYPLERMRIWKDSPMAINMSQHVPEQLRRFLGLQNELGLFRVGAGYEREVFRCAPRKEELGWQPVTGFADAYPIHIQNLASVRDLGRRIEQEVPRLSVLRFRPNIIVTGPNAYDEDSWKRIRIGNQVYYTACRTARCLLPNVDPETAVKHRAEPDRTMKTFRCIDEGAGPKLACLGMQVVPGFQRGIITVGDSLEILETGKHFYMKQ